MWWTKRPSYSRAIPGAFRQMRWILRCSQARRTGRRMTRFPHCKPATAAPQSAINDRNGGVKHTAKRNGMRCTMHKSSNPAFEKRKNLGNKMHNIVGGTVCCAFCVSLNAIFEKVAREKHSVAILHAITKNFGILTKKRTSIGMAQILKRS